MEEQKILKKQFVLHVFYNMIAFATIFICFGIFMFFMVKNITFSAVDNQLKESRNKFNEINVKIEMLYDALNIDSSMAIGNSIYNFSNYNMSQKIDNPQVTLILRDSEGNILNSDDLGRLKDYITSTNYDNTKLDNTYTIKLKNKYNYRCLNFVINSIDSSNTMYGQLLINVDSEISLVNNYLKIISYAVLFGIVISGIASFILSNKTLKPIEETLKKQTEFVQNASHELRTPLTIIQAQQELLLQEPNSKIIDKSEEIMLTLNETKRLSKLTKDLLILLRGTNPKNINLQKEDVEIDRFIENIVQPYIDIVNAQDKKLSLNLQFNKEVSIDTNKIHQLLVILLDNAIKYTETGDEIQINTYLKDNKCVIEVIDTGIGISDEGLKHVFDRFYRENRDRNRQTGGSGLGLSIATTIVNAHGGTIKASHNLPKGSIFTVKLAR